VAYGKYHLNTEVVVSANNIQGAKEDGVSGAWKIDEGFDSIGRHDDRAGRETKKIIRHVPLRNLM
jgi:acyl-CoA synthetase (NDP forming)